MYYVATIHCYYPQDDKTSMLA